jgi:pimeloyl-ACP methyl ester carboxylesterase
MLTNKLINLVTTLRFLSIGLMAAYSTYAQSYATVNNEAFYIPPANLSQYARGDLIRWEVEPDMDYAYFAKYAVAYRVMYASKGAAGQKIAATAMIFIPFIDGNGNPIDKNKKFDAIVWAHGTTGVGDNCAPSKWPMLYPVYEWEGYTRPASLIIKNGFAAIAPDYEGLGTPGVHPWLHQESAGNTIIDAVRAYQKLGTKVGYKITKNWGVWGHSQGSMAARAANVLAKKTAPELKFVGSVEVAGVNNVNLSGDLIEQVATTTFGGYPYVGYGAQAIRSLNPQFVEENLLGPLYLQEIEVQPSVFVPLFELAAETCWDDWFYGSFGMFGFNPPADEVRNANFASDPVVKDWLKAMGFGGFGYNDNTLSNASGPALMIFGEIDDLFTAEMRAAYLEDLDAAGALEYSTMVIPEAGHDQSLQYSEQDAIDWLREQF